MDDQFLYRFRKDPAPEFAEALLQQLHQQKQLEASRSRRFWRPALALSGALTVVAVLVSFPSVRAAAQQFLDLFRVQRFVAVSIDPARIAQIEKLQSGKLDLKALLSRDIQVLKEPGQPKVFSDLGAASQAAGFDARLPVTLPEGMRQDEIRGTGDGMVRFTADTSKLADLLESMEITDVQLPSQLNGAVIDIRVPPCVITSYSRGKDRVTLVQANSPEITLPAGVFLPQMAEIGLRVAGLSSQEARRLAYSLDWHSTLLVPVPANAASFREVELHGTKGLLIETRQLRSQEGSGRPHGRSGAALLWSEGGKVFALSGTVLIPELLEMANAM